MKVFERFSTQEAHERIVRGLINEKAIRLRIDEIKELEAKGLTTLGQVEDFLANKKNKDDKYKRTAFTSKSIDKSR